MVSIHGGDTVKGGFYWNLGKWDATFVEGDGGVLPGEASDRFRRIPVVLALVAAPIMGALFVIFLPFVGIALMLKQLGVASLAVAGRTVERSLPVAGDVHGAPGEFGESSLEDDDRAESIDERRKR